MKSIENNSIFQLYSESVNPTQASIEDQRKIADFFVDLIVRIENGDADAVSLLNLPQADLIKHIESIKNNVNTEAFENIRSVIGGSFSGSGPAKKRYEIFLNTVKKKLWELGEDIKTTSDQNNIQVYDDLIQKIQAVEPNMVPEGGSLQKKLYGAGKIASKVGKMAGFSAGAGLLASALSSIGIPAIAIGAIVGGGISTLKNLSNTNLTPQEKLKKALMGAGLGAITGYALGELKELLGYSGENTESSTENTKSSTDSNYYDVLNDKNIDVTKNTNDEIEVVVKSKTMPQTSISERMYGDRGKLKGTLAISKLLGVDSVRGIETSNVMGDDGYLYTTVKWSQATSDTAKQISDTMSRPMGD